MPRRATDKRSSRRPAANTVCPLGGYHGDERRLVLESEEARLDRLESRSRERDAAEAAKVERRLLGVTKLREAIRQ